MADDKTIDLRNQRNYQRTGVSQTVDDGRLAAITIRHSVKSRRGDGSNCRRITRLLLPKNHSTVTDFARLRG